MIKVRDISKLIEEIAPLSLQDSYDNAGLLIGSPDADVTGALICLDVTEEIVNEAINKNLNLIISHHPLIFKGIKSLNGKTDQERAIMKAVKNDIAVYAAHTNLDNVLEGGVNKILADKIGLGKQKVLRPKSDTFIKLVTFAPTFHIQKIRDALFEAGAGVIGNYDSCSFSSQGTGSFKANDDAHPFVGNLNEIHYENEIRLELILPNYLKNKVVRKLLEVHPYEEPAFDLIPLSNDWNSVGAGLVGELEKDMDISEFLTSLKHILKSDCLKVTAFTKNNVRKIALCGGSGSFLLKDAIAANADVFISADFKYHDYFDAENKIIIVDAGHFETEQFTKDIFKEIITKKLPKFAVQISEINTNPIKYL